MTAAGSAATIVAGLTVWAVLVPEALGMRWRARTRRCRRRRRTSSWWSIGLTAFRSPSGSAAALRTARQSVVVGPGLSVGAMFVAAFGYLPPVWGALFQEGIDVAVILNALRALQG